MPTVLITGAGRGIGLVTALHMARNGYDVFAGVHMLSQAGALEAAAAEGLPIRVLEMDVTDPASVDRAVGEVLAAGDLDVLVNNAGIGNLGTVESITDDVLGRVLDVNLFGTLRAVRAVLPAMRARRSGAIVTMSSVNGRIALPVGGPYFISKHALEAATEMLAVEVRGFGIRVALVEPGAFATEILQDGLDSASPQPGSPYETVQRRSAAMVAQGIARAGDPIEVAQAVLDAVTTDEPKLRHLVGDDARMLLDARSRASDEEWVELGGVAGDEEYFARMMALLAPAPAVA
jgi:NAD(P)-dependent dehydrogenase (short-subunit alcohol dehydrogenase family)